MGNLYACEGPSVCRKGHFAPLKMCLITPLSSVYITYCIVSNFNKDSLIHILPPLFLEFLFLSFVENSFKNLRLI